MIARSGTDTRARLLDTAEAMINEVGFSATSVDKIIDAVGVTKGSFFYHFKSKQDLALALIERFAERDQQILRSSMERAERLIDDPLQQLLIFIGLIIEVAETLDREARPGCLFASYCFEGGLFDKETHAIICAGLGEWTHRVHAKLEEAAKLHRVQSKVDFESLAAMISVLFEGAFVMARVFPGQNTFANQMRHYRSYVRLLFGVG